LIRDSYDHFAPTQTLILRMRGEFQEDCMFHLHDEIRYEMRDKAYRWLGKVPGAEDILSLGPFRLWLDASLVSALASTGYGAHSCDVALWHVEHHAPSIVFECSRPYPERNMRLLVEEWIFGCGRDVRAMVQFDFWYENGREAKCSVSRSVEWKADGKSTRVLVKSGDKVGSSRPEDSWRCAKTLQIFRAANGEVSKDPSADL
jgi:hypothetical protein